ncbi:MAG: NAD-dependent malic enzyme [Dermatophilaceae bacterium]
MLYHHDYELDTTRRDAPIRISARGRAVLANPMTNRATAFTVQERRYLGLVGLMPGGVTSLGNQVRRVYAQYQSAKTAFAKHNYLANLRDRNEILFYRLLADHIEEMMPIIYTPTIGEVIERFSHEYNRSRGVFLSIDRPEDVEQSLLDYGLPSDDVDLIVLTDSEGILGIGDQGIGGIEIAIGKLSVYTAAAGLHPRRVIPVVLDVGTDNLGLLNSDLYLGERHARVRGERYDDFMDHVVQTASRLFPKAMLHWEDFGASNAHRLLEKYRHTHCTFNDDIQGTAAVALAAVLAGVNVTGMPLHEHRIVIFGGGTAGIGIADLLRDTLIRDGVDPEVAQSQFYVLGSKGLFVDDMTSLREFQVPYARTRDEVSKWVLGGPGGAAGAGAGVNGNGRNGNGRNGNGNGHPAISLADVVRNVRPTILIGTSTMGGAFTKVIVQDMAAHCDRPIIMPLSNPTARAEATPADLIEWTQGRALIATGSPFEPVDYREVRHVIAQANNALIFPGLGLGVAASDAARVTDGMIVAAAEALASLVNAYRPGASLLPRISELRPVSAHVALAVAQAAADEGVARHPLQDPVNEIYTRMWQPEYPPVEII